MKLTTTILLVLGVCAMACSASNDESSDPEALGGTSLTHFNFAASMLVGPSGPAYYAQLRPEKSEIADIMCPGPTYTPTARIYDSNKTIFTGSGGSCDGKYGKTTNGSIEIVCETPIQKRVCP